MAFRTPVFNLTCNLWRNAPALPPAGPPDLVLSCQLAWDGTGRFLLLPRAAATVPIHFMQLRLPFRTDVRGLSQTPTPDTVEVPAGTGRYYQVHRVDDVARGFANEYRCALISEISFPLTLP